MKSKQSRKFFVSPVKFTKVHVRGFVNEPTNYSTTGNRNGIYIWLRAFLRMEYFSLRIIPKILVADRTIFSI